MNTIGIGLIGIAGYGEAHRDSIDACEKEQKCRLRAAVVRLQDEDPDQERMLAGRGVRIYRTVREMLDNEKSRIELVAIPTGIPSHAGLSIAALDAGYHVLCEKPAAGTHVDALLMREAARRNGRFLAIGFQYIFTQAVQNLKRIRIEGQLGELRRIKTVTLWPRDTEYYSRNNWAGKLKVDGSKIYDSPAQNAMSHFLNTMLYVAGGRAAETAYPVELYGENYRAQNIESADTQFLRLRTDTDVDIVFIGSHASAIGIGPIIHFIFENGTVEFGASGAPEEYRIVTAARCPYELPTQPPQKSRADAFMDTLDAIGTGRPPLCTIENALPHSLCVQTLFEESCPVRDINPAYLEDLTSGGPGRGDGAAVNTVIKEIEPVTKRMFDEEKSFSEVTAPWAEPGRKVEITAC